MIKDDRPVLWPGSLRKSKCSILLLGAMLAVLPIKSMVRENHRDVPWDSNPIYVYCLVQIQIYPPRTSSYEFDGYTTRRSKAECVTTAVVSVKIAGE